MLCADGATEMDVRVAVVVPPLLLLLLPLQPVRSVKNTVVANSHRNCLALAIMFPFVMIGKSY